MAARYGAGAPRASRSREKVSVTIDRESLEQVRRVTDNVSEFVNEAVRDRLYFSRLEAELARLETDGIVPDPRGVEWWTEKMLATKQRLARQPTTRKSK